MLDGRDIPLKYCTEYDTTKITTRKARHHRHRACSRALNTDNEQPSVRSLARTVIHIDVHQKMDGCPPLYVTGYSSSSSAYLFVLVANLIDNEWTNAIS